VSTRRSRFSGVIIAFAKTNKERSQLPLGDRRGEMVYVKAASGVGKNDPCEK